MKLKLTKNETKELLENGSAEIERNGFDIFIEKRKYEPGYDIYLISPYEEIELAKINE